MVDQYTPTDEQVEAEWVAFMSTDDPDNYWDAISEDEAQARWSRWLAAHDARVRRDAAREALDGLARQEREFYGKGADQCGHVVHAAEEYRDTHYPEQEDQT